jgi:CRP/FNR family transcriptional regulator
MSPVKLAASQGMSIRMPLARCETCEIREISVCRSLAPHELARLQSIITSCQAEAGQPILHEGDPATDLFNVVSGAVKLYKLLPDGRRQMTGFLFPGDFLGIALNDTYVYTAEALTEVRLCRFPRPKLEALLAEIPALEHQLLGDVATELVAAQDQMLLLGRKTARERVASFLLMLSRRAERHGRPANPVALPMSRADIADYLGLTTETVSRTITQLRQSQTIEVATRGEIAIRNRDALAELSEGG